jgi:hypothetical protein
MADKGDAKTDGMLDAEWQEDTFSSDYSDDDLPYVMAGKGDSKADAILDDEWQEARWFPWQRHESAIRRAQATRRFPGDRQQQFPFLGMQIEGGHRKPL